MNTKKESESRSSWTAVLVIVNLTVLSSFALTYFYSTLFIWGNTLPASLTYFSLYYFLFFSEVWPRFFNKVWCRREERLVGPKESSSSIDSEVKSKWYVNFFSGEFTAFFILFFINVAFGVISSLVWWICGAMDQHTLLESLKIGGIFGSLPFVFIAIFMGGG